MGWSPLGGNLLTGTTHTHTHCIFYYSRDSSLGLTTLLLVHGVVLYVFVKSREMRNIFLLFGLKIRCGVVS